MRAEFNKGTVRLLLGNIADQDADVIVNAANETLSPGSGVNGALLHAGGLEIEEACYRHWMEHGVVPPGSAVATTAGKLKADWIVHAVGPVWKGGRLGEACILYAAYASAVAVAAGLGATSIAFPSLSTGVFGYPLEDAARIAMSRIAIEADSRDRPADIRFVLFTERDLKAYASALKDAAKGRRVYSE